MERGVVILVAVVELQAHRSASRIGRRSLRAQVASHLSIEALQLHKHLRSIERVAKEDVILQQRAIGERESAIGYDDNMSVVEGGLTLLDGEEDEMRAGLRRRD